MKIVLHHTIVPAHDKGAAARFFASVLGLEVGPPDGPFAPVAVNADLTLDFEDCQVFEAHHYAFLVDDETFEAALSRLRAAGTPIGSAPAAGWDGRVDISDRGKRVYFQDASGHAFELFTRAD